MFDDLDLIAHGGIGAGRGGETSETEKSDI